MRFWLVLALICLGRLPSGALAACGEQANGPDVRLSLLENSVLPLAPLAASPDEHAAPTDNGSVHVDSADSSCAAESHRTSVVWAPMVCGAVCPHRQAHRPDPLVCGPTSGCTLQACHVRLQV